MATLIAKLKDGTTSITDNGDGTVNIESDVLETSDLFVGGVDIDNILDQAEAKAFDVEETAVGLIAEAEVVDLTEEEPAPVVEPEPAPAPTGY